MNIKKLLAIGLIFIGFGIAWMILGDINSDRTKGQTRLLQKRLQNAYGGPLMITPPQIFYEVIKEKKGKVGGFETITSYKEKELMDPSRSDIEIDLKLERKKIGNLWFSTFLVEYRGEYEYDIESIPEKYRSYPLFLLPGLNSKESIYRSIKMNINDVAVQPLAKLVASNPIELTSIVTPSGKIIVNFYYKTTGTDHMLYVLAGQQKNDEQIKTTASGGRLTRLDNFDLKLRANFDNYEFPRRTIPPTSRKISEQINEFHWQFDKTVTGKNIGLIVPEEKNPGEIASRISFFAPVSLLFFFVVMMVFNILLRRELHPMHYFFLAATFLSFHLMFSYSADHISMYLAFGIASVISCILTFSYLIRFNGWKYSAIAVSLQLLYLVVFSWSFFYKTATGLGITGLIVTIVSVFTLFVLMQLIGKISWDEVFNKN